MSSRKTKLMIVGDGMHATIITGNLNVVDGSTTFRSATLGKVSTTYVYIVDVEPFSVFVIYTFDISNTLNENPGSAIMSKCNIY